MKYDDDTNEQVRPAIRRRTFCQCPQHRPAPPRRDWWTLAVVAFTVAAIFAAVVVLVVGAMR